MRACVWWGLSLPLLPPPQPSSLSKLVPACVCLLHLTTSCYIQPVLIPLRSAALRAVGLEDGRTDGVRMQGGTWDLDTDPAISRLHIGKTLQFPASIKCAREDDKKIYVPLARDKYGSHVTHSCLFPPASYFRQRFSSLRNLCRLILRGGVQPRVVAIEPNARHIKTKSIPTNLNPISETPILIWYTKVTSKPRA